MLCDFANLELRVAMCCLISKSKDLACYSFINYPGHLVSWLFGRMLTVHALLSWSWVSIMLAITWPQGALGEEENLTAAVQVDGQC
jgi:hypothetical protein